MNIRRNQLLSAIKSAKLHVDGSGITTVETTEQIGKETKPSNSRMVRLIGKGASENERKVIAYQSRSEKPPNLRPSC